MLMFCLVEGLRYLHWAPALKLSEASILAFIRVAMASMILHRASLADRPRPEEQQKAETKQKLAIHDDHTPF